jgi:hypothetical protein
MVRKRNAFRELADGELNGQAGGASLGQVNFE